MSEASVQAEKPEPFVIRVGGKAFGPCSACGFYNPHGTKAAHATGKCHGAPPSPQTGHAIVPANHPGCAAFRAAR